MSTKLNRITGKKSPIPARNRITTKPRCLQRLPQRKEKNSPSTITSTSQVANGRSMTSWLKTSAWSTTIAPISTGFLPTPRLISCSASYEKRRPILSGQEGKDIQPNGQGGLYV